MQNPITETAHATLGGYANYREKQLLAVGDVSACFVSVISRVRRSAYRFLWFTWLANITVAGIVAWLAYNSAVRNDLTVLACFAPVLLLTISRMFSLLSKVGHSAARLETLAELWLKYDRQPQLSSDRIPPIL